MMNNFVSNSISDSSLVCAVNIVKNMRFTVKFMNIFVRFNRPDMFVCLYVCLLDRDV